MTMTDKGEPGSADSIALTLWNGSTLVFSSNWDGAKTPEQVLGRRQLRRSLTGSIQRRT